MHQSPSHRKDPIAMSHGEFVSGYENGNLGCSVSVLLTLRLLIAGRICEKRISARLLLWSFGFLLLITASVIEFLKLSFLWALLCTACMLAIYTPSFFYSAGELVLSAALANKDFYEVASAERVLRIYSDDERNLPKLQKDRN
jgi:hypothetical protein